jgi:hypothetical protein
MPSLPTTMQRGSLCVAALALQAQWCVCPDAGAHGTGPYGHHAVVPDTQGAGRGTLYSVLRTTCHPSVSVQAQAQLRGGEECRYSFHVVFGQVTSTPTGVHLASYDLNNCWYRGTRCMPLLPSRCVAS